jgi:hypothetical protein
MNRIRTMIEDADLTLLDIVSGTVCVLAIAACWILTS